MFDDPSYVNVDKTRPPTSAANGNAHRDAFDMSECVCLFLCLSKSCVCIGVTQEGNTFSRQCSLFQKHSFFLEITKKILSSMSYCHIDVDIVMFFHIHTSFQRKYI